MLKLSFLPLMLFIPVNAAAFSLYTTENGDHVRWAPGTRVVVLDESLSALGPWGEVEDIILDAFDLWLEHADIPIDFTFYRGRCAASRRTNTSCISACDDPRQCYDRGSEKGATTYLHYLPSEARIIGMRVIINAADWRWRTGEGLPSEDEARDASPDAAFAKASSVSSPLPALSLARVILHEVGHVLGIDHSDDPNAVMYYAMEPDDPAPTGLANDDIAAAGTLYGAVDDAVIEEIETYSGCMAVAASRRVPSEPLGVLTLVSLVVLISVRSRRENDRATGDFLRSSARSSRPPRNATAECSRTRRFWPER